MEGYYVEDVCQYMSSSTSSIVRVQLNGIWSYDQLTDVVFTPQLSHFSKAGVSAGGVSMNSKSEPLMLTGSEAIFPRVSN